MPTNSKIVISDLDGTLASNAWRDYLVEEKENSPKDKNGKFKKDWWKFHQSLVSDPVIPSTLSLLKSLEAEGNKIVYLTGRPEKLRGITEKWLRENGAPVGELFMKPQGQDNKPSDKFKEEVLLNLLSQGNTVTLALDDDAKNLEMFERNGVKAQKIIDPGLTPQKMETPVSSSYAARVLVTASRILSN